MFAAHLVQIREETASLIVALEHCMCTFIVLLPVYALPLGGLHDGLSI